MRITGGFRKGFVVSPPKGIKARPTTDFTKEALFNILTNSYNFAELAILDLFAGTGSISYEFASRGAASIVAVELTYKSCSFIKKEVERLGFKGVEVINRDALEFISSSREQFNIIFADPPYDAPFIEELPELIFGSDLLTTEGLFILEHSAAHNFQHSPHFTKERRYGDSHLSFFIKKGVEK